MFEFSSEQKRGTIPALLDRFKKKRKKKLQYKSEDKKNFREP